MKKAEARKLFLKKRKNLSEKEYLEQNKQIYQLFVKHFVIGKNDKIHIYLSNNERKEVDTWKLIKTLRKKDTIITIPKVNGSEFMNCELRQNEILEKNKWNIEEPFQCNVFSPQNLNIIIVPSVICDFNGHRVGYGKGYYDKFLSSCKKNTLKITFNFFNPIESIDDVEEHDVKVDYCITPMKIIDFRENK